MYRCAFFRQRGYVRGALVSHIVAGGLALCVDGKPAFRADVGVLYTAITRARELLLLVGYDYAVVREILRLADYRYPGVKIQELDKPRVSRSDVISHDDRRSALVIQKLGNQPRRLGLCEVLLGACREVNRPGKHRGVKEQAAAQPGYQAVRRCWRFGQKSDVDVYIIISAQEGAVKENIERKQRDNEQMKEHLIELTKDITRRELTATVRISTEYEPHKAMRLPEWEEMKHYA